MMRTIDQNNSGYIERAELERGFKGLGVRIGKKDLDGILQAFDTNGDGLIAYSAPACSIECSTGCSIECSIECSFKCATECSIECSIKYFTTCSTACVTACFIEHSIECPTECSISHWQKSSRHHAGVRQERRWADRFFYNELYRMPAHMPAHMSSHMSIHIPAPMSSHMSSHMSAHMSTHMSMHMDNALQAQCSIEPLTSYGLYSYGLGAGAI